MSQDNTKQPDSRKGQTSDQQRQGPRTASTPSQQIGQKAKSDSGCTPCSENASRSLTPSAQGSGDKDRQTAPGQQGRTGSTYGGEQAAKEMEAEGGAEGRSAERGSTGKRPERPAR